MEKHFDELQRESEQEFEAVRVQLRAVDDKSRSLKTGLRNLRSKCTALKRRVDMGASSWSQALATGVLTSRRSSALKLSDITSSLKSARAAAVAALRACVVCTASQ